MKSKVQKKESVIEREHSPHYIKNSKYDHDDDYDDNGNINSISSSISLKSPMINING